MPCGGAERGSGLIETQVAVFSKPQEELLYAAAYLEFCRKGGAGGGKIV